jgi:hypothetical protein
MHFLMFVNSIAEQQADTGDLLRPIYCEIDLFLDLSMCFNAC